MFKIYDNKFIGYNQDHNDEEFTGSDNKELFQENLKTKPLDWYYRTTPIVYKRNSWGHRCKDIKDLDKNNYILSVGCSFTEGVGLEQEKTYTHVLAEKLNCDYYNLGLGGSGIDTVLHNLTMWLTTITEKPKLVIVQWPYWGRFAHFNRPPTCCELKDNTVILINAHSDYKSINDFFGSSEEFNYFESVEMLAKIKIESLLEHAQIPYLNAGVYYGSRKRMIFKQPFISFNRKDVARDLHFGIESHSNIASNIYLEYCNMDK
jgi:hypothetical protein